MLLRRRAAMTDGVIDLYPAGLFGPEYERDFGEMHDYIITLHGQRQEIGRCSARRGESAPMYYFGHVGYHIDPPWRGHHYAARAVTLLRGLMGRWGLRSCVITCDPDNMPSRRTCELLGAVPERTVDVPREVRARWEISPRKVRYILRLEEQA